MGAKYDVAEIPAELADEADAAREFMLEEICANDEALMESYNFV